MAGNYKFLRNPFRARVRCARLVRIVDVFYWRKVILIMICLVIGSFVISGVLLIQGIHILKKGDMRPFFLQSGDLPGWKSNRRSSARFAIASVYLIPSIAIYCILTIAIFKNDKQVLFTWLMEHTYSVIGGFVTLIYGLMALLRPDVVIKWALSQYPGYNLEELNPWISHLTRISGVIMCVLSCTIFRSSDL
jgi:hypothetical protein